MCKIECNLNKNSSGLVRLGTLKFLRTVLNTFYLSLSIQTFFKTQNEQVIHERQKGKYSTDFINLQSHEKKMIPFLSLIFVLINEYHLFSRFFVDDVPIRRYPRKSDATFPLRPMWVYGSIWDASSWATEDGKYKADYQYQPFVGSYTDFKATGCTAYAPGWCRPVSASPFPSGGLSSSQRLAMSWVHSHSLVYDYCRDQKRDHSLTPECWG